MVFFEKIFYEKISLFQGWLLVGCGVAFLLAGVHFLADIDQVDLLGGGGEPFCRLQRKLFSVSVFSLIFMVSLAIFS